MSTGQGYDIVLKDLEDRQRQCAEEIQRRVEEQKMLAQMIANLRRFISSSSQAPLPFQRSLVPQSGSQSAPTVGKYSGMSVRWAILYLLSEHSGPALGTSEIADMLSGGGITS